MHRSYRFENEGIEVDNQRLEFLGDAVLGFLAAAHLYDTLRDKNEGILTALRSRITSGKALAEVAESLGLGNHLLVGKGEEGSGGRTRPSNLADAMEAVLGAVYLDSGLKGLTKVFKKIFVPLVRELSDDVWEENPKGRLQEYAQARWKKSPVYRMVKTVGPAHAAVFTVEVRINGKVWGTGIGRSKQDAERRAALAALQGFQD